MAGKGLEAIVTNISSKLGDIEVAIDEIYYGNPTKKNTGIKLPGNKSKVNGILPLVQEISKFDLCNIVTLVLSNVDLNTIAGKDTITGKKIQALQDKARKLAKELDGGSLTSNTVKDGTKLSKINESLKEILTSIDSDTVAALPQLANTVNYLEDIRGTLTAFEPQTPGTTSQFQNLNTIPNAEVQRVLNKIRGVQSTLYSLSNIKSIQDVLNLANNAAGLNIANQLKELQKIIDPARLLPAFKQVANTLTAINQIILKVLNYIKILQTIGKVAQVLLKVLNVIAKVLSFIPIPNISTTVTVTQKFSDTLQKIRRLIEDTLKRVREIQALIELLYSFTVDLSAKVFEIKELVNVLVFNLESCESLTDVSEPIVKELKVGITRIDSGITRLSQFTDTYAAATRNNRNGNEITYNGYILRIVEEEVVDRSVRNKRRKAIALDSRGVLVAETDLTFATDRYTLYEELKLLLKNQGLISDTGAVIGVDLTEDYISDQDIYSDIDIDSEQELVNTTAAVNAEINTFIKGIKKGGRKFRRKIRQITAKFASTSAQALKQAAKEGNFKSTSGIANKFAGSFGKAAKVSQGSLSADREGAEQVSQDILTDEQRTKWIRIVTNDYISSSLRQKAYEILQKDTIARAQQG